jgi:ubiquinone/menaquinone biosynthesis C-methylase UbiE
MKEYYDLRAPYYDDWWIGAARDHPGWAEELEDALAAVTALPPARTLDIACGTGYLTRHLTGEVVGLDQSASMLDEARRRLPDGEFVQGDALELPFPDGAFERIFTSYFYCHLVEEERVRFLAEARRVASELVVLGSRHSEGEELERWEDRPLKDGTTWPVFKRVFDPEGLAAELGGDVLHAGQRFVVVRAA